MKSTKRELKYAKEHFNEVHHTTLNPEGPGVVRIHLIPPSIEDDYVGPSVAIINGQDIIPVNTAWSILLTEFIEETNQYDGREINEEDFKTIIENTCKKTGKLQADGQSISHDSKIGLQKRSFQNDEYLQAGGIS